MADHERAEEAREEMAARFAGVVHNQDDGTWAADMALDVLRSLPIEQRLNAIGLDSWEALMALLDRHWPEDIFPTLDDDQTRDAGARIVSLLRVVDRLRGRTWGEKFDDLMSVPIHNVQMPREAFDDD